MNIGALERFAADYEREQGEIAIPLIPETTGKKNCSCWFRAPAGLTVAGELAKLGHRVTISKLCMKQVVFLYMGYLNLDFQRKLLRQR